jgi:hypothetical protein
MEKWYFKMGLFIKEIINLIKWTEKASFIMNLTGRLMTDFGRAINSTATEFFTTNILSK